MLKNHERKKETGGHTTLTVFKSPSTSQNAGPCVLTVTGFVKRTAVANALFVDNGVWFNGANFGDLGLGESDNDRKPC